MKNIRPTGDYSNRGVWMNRQYAFYVPELDAIIIQCFYDNCRVVFHWDWFDCTQAYENIKDSGIDDPLDIFFLMPLGEV